MLLTIQDVGSLTLSWHPDHGIPWTALMADHWAGNYVLTVDLPADFVGKSPGSIVGPVTSLDKFSVGQIVRVEAARFDRPTRERIGNLLFESWLADQRSKAAIRWHWI
jgi:hypothetical protein